MTLPTAKEEAREELLHHNHIQGSIENYGETLIIRTRKAVVDELRQLKQDVLFFDGDDARAVFKREITRIINQLEKR